MSAKRPAKSLNVAQVGKVLLGAAAIAVEKVIGKIAEKRKQTKARATAKEKTAPARRSKATTAKKAPAKKPVAKAASKPATKKTGARSSKSGKKK
jgi:hypothetical protein